MQKRTLMMWVVIALVIVEAPFLAFLACDAPCNLLWPKVSSTGIHSNTIPARRRCARKWAQRVGQRFDSYYMHEHCGRRMIGVFERLTALRRGQRAR